MKRVRVRKFWHALAVAAMTAAFAFVPTANPLDAASAAAPSTGGYQQTKVLTRTHLKADGTNDTSTSTSKTVTVTVDKTANLYGRQDVNVSWKGAFPTGGVQPDYNSATAPDQEYPVAIMQCRGTPASATPETCYTHGPDARYQGVSYTSFGAWRLDRYESAANRAAVVGRPASLPATCPSPSSNERWVPYIGIDGKQYPYGNNSCAGIPPEDYTFDSSARAVPENATFAPTTIDGSGSAKFDIWTSAENASLGCSAAVACTLMIIPIVGISCDPYGVSADSAPLPSADVPSSTDLPRAMSFCEAGGNYAPGEPANLSNSANIPVSGALWWSASNWRNRFAVPLSFAPVSQACNVTTGGAPVDVYGSELMTEAAGQWSPKFCTDPTLFKLGHVATSEPLAQRLIADPTSGVYAAYSSVSPVGGFPTPTVQAPVAVTGLSISYTIDDSQGRPVTNLRLTPRLLAKLLTESYPADDFDRFGDNPYHTKSFKDVNGNTVVLPYLENNPINITRDPEFQALNPGITAGNGTAGAATLFAVSEESDLITALTSYIWSDPEARAWLSGQADPWGMIVNPYYSTALKPYFETAPLTLPVSRWPLLDTTTPDFGGNGNVPCNADPTNASPWLPLIATPTPNFASTALAVQFSAAPSKIRCASISGIPGTPSQWSSLGRSAPGQRFVIGVTTLAQARRYDLETAALQSHSTITDFAAKFTGAVGRTFVSPSDATLRAAAGLLTNDPTTNTWTLPYATLASLPGAGGAYPGTMLVNIDVPTSGVPAADARDFAKLMTFAAGPGQVPGAGNGQLPDGYLPMTSANGLGAQAAYTLRAADAVRAQTGSVPPLVPVHPQPSPTTSAASSPGVPSPTTAAPSSAALPTTAPTSGSSSPTPAPSARKTSPSAALAAARLRTPSFGAGFAGVILPLLLGIGALGALLSGGLLVLRPAPTRAAGRAAGHRLRLWRR